MEINIEDIDIMTLKKDLLDYFGTAINTVSYLAMAELIWVEKASAEELIKLALENNFNIEDYIISNRFSR